MTVKQTADMLGLSEQHVRRLLDAGTIKGDRFGHVWAVNERSAQRYADQVHRPGPKPGQRRKPAQ